MYGKTDKPLSFGADLNAKFLEDAMVQFSEDGILF